MEPKKAPALPPLCRLTLQERREAYQAAKAKLTPEDQIRIDKMVDALIAAVKADNGLVQLARDGALEVIAGLGIFLNKRMK